MVFGTRLGARLACALAALLGTRLAARLACALAVSVTLVGVGTANAATTRIGRLPSDLARAAVIGELPAGKLVHVTVALKPRNAAALSAYAQAVANPSSIDYRGYLTPAQFARRFGASPAELRAVRRGLEARGLRPGPVSAGGLSMSVTATAAQLDHGFSLSLRRVALRDGHTAVAASSAPALGADAAAGVQAVVGLNSLSTPQPLLVRPRQDSRRRAPLAERHVATGGPQPCSSAQSAASAEGAHTADQIASAYGYSGLYAAGDRGQGTTVAVYELEPVDPSDLAAYQSCYGTHTQISYVKVDGGAGNGSGSGEAALDIEQLIGLAADVNLVVYEGQNSDSGAPGAGPYDTFKTIINQDRAQVVSVSWGECEQLLGAGNAAAENTLFEQAAVQGQSIVSAAGDSGSEDCDGDSDVPQTQLAVDDPASQPYVMGVGGTTLGAIGPRPTESVWNDGGGLLSPLLQPGAGGGGISNLWQMPPAQRDAAASLNVLGAGVTGSDCGAPGGYCREVPDVAADADPATGYVIYWNGSGTQPGQPTGWQAIGGTSAAAPVWAALIALADSSRGCAKSGPLGYVLPALYRAASSSYASDFNDVQTGNNDFTKTNGGLYAAGSGYDEASGLGSPNGAALASNLCPDTLRITNPGSQKSAAESTVSLRLRARDVRGAALRFRSLGLPTGLSLDQTTGQISGRIKHAGTYHVIVAAVDGQASVAAAKLTWTAGGATRILDASLTGAADHRPTLSFTVAAGRGSPALQDLTVMLPKELVLASTRGVSLTIGGGRPRFTASSTGGALVITLRRAVGRVRVTLSYPALRVAAGRQPNASGREAGEVTVQVTNASRGSSRVRAHV
jgi:Pro-kumamolisin, activation domain/Putative Ig domain